MTAPSATMKHRLLVFSADPPGQAERALELLKGLDNFAVEHGEQPDTLYVSYNLRDYSFAGLERALHKEGFRLDDSALSELRRKLIHYSEEVEYHNLNTPTPGDLAKSHEREIFARVYEHHLHGDHDDTPSEWREYK